MIPTVVSCVPELADGHVKEAVGGVVQEPVVVVAEPVMAVVKAIVVALAMVVSISGDYCSGGCGNTCAYGDGKLVSTRLLLKL